MVISILGYIFAGLAAGLIAFLFVYLIKKEKHMKKLPKWLYALVIIAFILGIAAIALLVAAAAMKHAG